MTILKLENIHTGYDKKQVLFDINFELEQGECALLVGSNGSGKSTFLKVVNRSLNVWNNKGKIIFNNEDITGLKVHQLIERGIVCIPQKDELFGDLTIHENLELSILHLKDRIEVRKRVKTILKQLPLLNQKLKQEVNSLSGGERKLVSLAMALLNKPKLVMYDEPLAGLSGENVKIMIRHLKQIKESGATLVLIEHRLKELIPLADRIFGLKLGHVNKQELKTLEDIKTFMI